MTTTDTPRTDGCKCQTLTERALGDGCDECNKALVIEMLTDERDELAAEVDRLGGLLYETRSLLTEFFDCVDIGGLHDGDCNISTEDPEKWDLGCNCTTAELKRKYIKLYSK